MSTSYMPRRPLKRGQVLRALPGWHVEHVVQDGIPTDLLAGPGGFLHADFDQKDRLFAFERYGGNDPSDVLEAIDCVSEHDEDDPDYDKLFGGE